MTEEERLEKEALTLQIQELETMLDERDDEIDRLNTEILEMQKYGVDIEAVSREARQEAARFKANILDNIDRLEGLPLEEWTRRAHRFLYETKHYIEMEGDPRRFMIDDNQRRLYASIKVDPSKNFGIVYTEKP